MRALPVASAALLIGLSGLASYGLALERPKNIQAREAFCAEESRAAMAWVDWAHSEKIRCLAISEASGQRSCLDQVRADIKTMESEHAQVYRTQMQALRPEHPVRRALDKKLKERSDWAAVAIDGSIEPTQIALTLHSSCMNQR